MRRKRDVRNGREWVDEAKQGMSPLIDVVFLLLVFFVVTARAHDVLSSFEAVRPTVPPPIEDPLPPTLRIDLHGTGVMLNGRPVSFEKLEDYLRTFGRYSTNQYIAVSSTEDASHGQLVRVLNICTHVGLRKISVFSR